MSTPAIPDPEQRPFMRLWPDVGRLLGLSRSATYAAAERGEIAVVRYGSRLMTPTAWLRRQAQLDEVPTGPA